MRDLMAVLRCNKQETRKSRAISSSGKGLLMCTYCGGQSQHEQQCVHSNDSEIGTQRMADAYWCEQTEREELPVYDGSKYVRSTGRYSSLPRQRSQAPAAQAPAAHPGRQARQAEIYQAQTATASAQEPVILRSVDGYNPDKLSGHYAAETPIRGTPSSSKSEANTAKFAARHQAGSTARDITPEEKIAEPVPQNFVPTSEAEDVQARLPKTAPQLKEQEPAVDGQCAL